MKYIQILLIVLSVNFISADSEKLDPIIFMLDLMNRQSKGPAVSFKLQRICVMAANRVAPPYGALSLVYRGDIFFAFLKRLF